MVELIIGIIIFIIVGLPLLSYLFLTIQGKRRIKKKELYVSWFCGFLFLTFIIVRLSLGSGISSISPFDIYFIVFAIAETIAYKKQRQS